MTSRERSRILTAIIEGSRQNLTELSQTRARDWQTQLETTSLRLRSQLERAGGFRTPQGVWSRDRDEYSAILQADIRRALVSTSISQQNPPNHALACGTGRWQPSQIVAPAECPRSHSWLEVYPMDVRIRRTQRHLRSRPPVTSRRGAIDAFSDRSRAGLRFKAANSGYPLISQFGLTYHEEYGDGDNVKRDLNRFLTWFRQNYVGIKYLWVLEFQERGFPHIHLYLSCKADADMGFRMAKKWNRIAGRRSPEHLRFHSDNRNYIAWRMDNANYLTKYIDKEAQKRVPVNFGWVGRFWACSRGLVGYPVFIDEDLVDRGAISRVARGIGRWHESRLRRYGRQSFVRRSHNSRLVPCASKIVFDLLDLSTGAPPRSSFGAWNM